MRTATTIVLLGVAIAALLPAQCPPPAWSAMTTPPGTTGAGSSVNALAVYGGDLVAGTSDGTVARWDGAAWQVIGGMDGPIRVLAVHNGELYAGGEFVAANGNTAQGIARWTGSGWAPLWSGLPADVPGVEGSVRALASFGGELVAGGVFTVAGSVFGNGIARWNGSTWAALGTGASFPVIALAIYGGDVIAGGAGNPWTQHCLERWNGAWQTIAGAPTSSTPFPIVNALAVQGGELIAGGAFTTAGTFAAGNIARWNGLGWQPLGTGTNGAILALTVFGGNLVAGGSFTVAGGQPANHVAEWNGASWQPLGAGVGAAGEAAAAFAILGGALLAGGSFGTAGGLPAPYLARWSSPLPLLAFSQPNGVGTGVVVTNRWLVPGHEYYDVASITPCSLGAGTGPYGGLCFPNVADLTAQLLLPIGAEPFHVVASATDASYGPYVLPVGLSIEAISADVTGGVLGCMSPVAPWTVY